MKLNDMHLRQEMKEFFDERTAEHINLVQKYAKKIAETNPNLKDVVEQASNHDASKYEDPEYVPYLYITWRYKHRNEGSNYEIPDFVDHNAATLHHIKNNRHHPEFHDEENNDQSLNAKDRDAIPPRSTDASKMNDIDIAEMVADWCAMSEELGDTPKSWADKNVNKRWNFTDDQVKLIYKLISDIWGDNES